MGVVILIALGGPVFLLITSYDNFIDLVLDWLDRSQYRNVAIQLFPKSRFSLVRWASVVLGVLISFLLISNQTSISRMHEQLVHTIGKGWSSIKGQLNWHHYPGKFLCLLLLISTVRMMYYIITMPLIYDECWTFLNFTIQGPLSAMLTYPSSNNHMLISMISSVLHWLHIPPELSLRLPVLFSGLMSMVVCYRLCSQYFGHKISSLITTFYSCSLPLSLYMILGRGYSTICLCYIILLYAVFVKKRVGAFFVLASIIGFYSIPIFFYPFTLIAAYLLFEIISNKRTFKSLNRPFVVIIIGVAVLYAPLLMTNTFVLSVERNANLFATEMSIQFVLQYFVDLFSYLLGTIYFLPVLGACVLAIIILAQRQRNLQLLVFSGLALVSPALFVIIQEMRIPLRVFTFLIINLLFIVGYLLKISKAEIRLKHSVVFVACICIWLFYSSLFHLHPAVNRLKNEIEELHLVSKDLLREGRQSIYLDHEVIKPFISFNAMLNNKQVDIKMAQINSLDHKDYSAADYYDAIIVSRSTFIIDTDDIPEEMYQKISYDHFTLYELKCNNPLMNKP
ncbi:MAG: hypothetical protein HKN87_14205 [Saprospiraceae bacterium]|nr:hypothetical protein [Saprospiraceae bacterium]